MAYAARIEELRRRPQKDRAGRALIEAGRLDEAAQAPRNVLRVAPDNRAAAGARDDIATRRRPAAGTPLAEFERGLTRIVADRERRRAAAGGQRAVR